MQSSRGEQIKVYFGKCWRIFRNENGWKVFLSSAIITFLISCVTGADMFKGYRATRNGAFALVCACIWIGIFNSIQSVCKERDIIKREHRSGLSIFSYLNAHALFELMQCLLEAVIVTVMTLLFNSANVPSSGPIMPVAVELTVTFFVIIFSSDMLGLMISCIVKTPQTAMTVMPFVLILQLIMSGMIFELKGATEKISYLMISKWGLNAICISANVNAMAGTSGNEDYEFKVMNLLKMWGIPIGYAFVYILLGIAFLSLVDRDKR